ncbi:MAG TPA: hypothetical protein VJS64_14720, partial [Pyrinomonadaceae bacterium]|nr:hypothetical protein [Pyrinomonadaceae bacterium]
KTIAILGLFIMLAITSVSAQAPGRVEVKIPFDFAAGKAEFKAGAYSIKRVSNNVLAIRSIDRKTTRLVDAPLAIDSRDSKAGARVVFNQYGGQYFLSQVWLTVESGRQLFTSGAEEKAANDYRLAHKNEKAGRVEIAASR